MSVRELTDATLSSARAFYGRHADDKATATTYAYFTHHPFARLNHKRLHIIAGVVARRSGVLGRELRILDLASGGGIITCALAAQGHRAVGLDLSHDEIRMARTFASEERLAGEFVQADLIEDEWEAPTEALLGGKPDVVTLAYALHHFPPDRVAGFVGRLGDWLDPGALALVNEENPRSPAWRAKHWLRSRIQHDTDTEWHQLPAAWRSMFAASGFTVNPELVAADMTPGVATIAPHVAWSVVFTAVRR
jgi:2-polyprenyl-3-methyl-5-hydroxy-6-metoxy-1,4-benzoquinol methylase